MPHTTEEIWGFLQEPEEFVQLSEMPEPKHFANEKEVTAEWNNFLNFRKDVLKAMEDARNDKVIGKPSEAKLILYVDEDTKSFGLLNVDVAQILMVSNLNSSIEDAEDDVTTFGDNLLSKCNILMVKFCNVVV